MATILLFSETSQRYYFFGENESIILLFGVGREYDFAESGGTGTLFQMLRFFFVKSFGIVIPKSEPLLTDEFFSDIILSHAMDQLCKSGG